MTLSGMSDFFLNDLDLETKGLYSFANQSQHVDLVIKYLQTEDWQQLTAFLHLAFRTRNS